MGRDVPENGARMHCFVTIAWVRCSEHVEKHTTVQADQRKHFFVLLLYGHVVREMMPMDTDTQEIVHRRGVILGLYATT